MFPCVFLIGLHGSGKTTIGRQLQRHHGYTHVSLGDLGRLARQSKYPCEHTLRFMTALASQEPGQPLRDRVVQVVLQEIDRLRQSGPVSVDGFPAEPTHIELLPTDGAIVHISLPEDMRENRLLRRASNTKRLWTPGQRSIRDEQVPRIVDAALASGYPVLGIENSADVSCAVDAISGFESPIKYR